MTAPRLFHFRVSHYNEKVRWALDHKKWPHTRRAFVPGFHVVPVFLRTGQKRLPVLVLDGRAHCGSAHILEEVERRRPGAPLFPESPDDRARAREIERYFDDEVAPEWRRLFWSAYIDDLPACARLAADGFSQRTRNVFRVMIPVLRPIFRANMGLSRARIEHARARMSAHVDHLESLIRPSGYLVGDRFGVADLCAAAVMTAIIRPPQFPYPLPEPWPPALVALRESISGRAGFEWVLDIYRRHRAPSAEIAG